MHYVTNSLPVAAVQKLLKSVKICQSYRQKLTAITKDEEYLMAKDIFNKIDK